MLFVETYLAPSDIDGIGLFAAEDIRSGTVIWRLVPGFDVIVDEVELRKMPDTARQFMFKYASLSKQLGKYVLSADDDRFTNHSYTPNRVDVVERAGEEVVSIAAYDIQVGEELTEDYRMIDANFYLYEDELT